VNPFQAPRTCLRRSRDSHVLKHFVESLFWIEPFNIPNHIGLEVGFMERQGRPEGKTIGSKTQTTSQRLGYELVPIEPKAT